jgi:hypothetical protein
MEGRDLRRPGATNAGVQPGLSWLSRPEKDPHRSAATCAVQEQHNSGVQPELEGRSALCVSTTENMAARQERVKGNELVGGHTAGQASEA